MSAGDYQGTYAPEKVVVTVGGVTVSGFADGDFITAAYDEDRYFKRVGSDGEVGRAKNASKAGTIEIVLSQTSGANDELNAIFGLSALAGIDAAVPVAVADLSGRSLVFASKAWLKTAPEMIMSKEIGDRTWVLDCADMVFSHGGNG